MAEIFDHNHKPVETRSRGHHLRRKAAQEDPEMRALLDRDLDPGQTYEIVKSAPSEAIKRARQVIETDLLNHVDPEVRHGAELILKSAGVTRGSPLFDRISSRVRAGSPPATQPLSSTGGSHVGHQDTAPGQAVDDLDRVVMHRHEGTPEARTPYWHAHEHNDQVNADPTAAGIATYDTRQHLVDERHRQANERFEAKSAAAGIEDAIRAINADSEWTTKALVSDRDFYVSQEGRRRLARNTAIVRDLQKTAELAELRKLVSPSVSKRSRTRPVAKASVYDPSTEEIARTVRAAVDRAMNGLGRRIEDLNRRAG